MSPHQCHLPGQHTVGRHCGGTGLRLATLGLCLDMALQQLINSEPGGKAKRTL